MSRQHEKALRDALDNLFEVADQVYRDGINTPGVERAALVEPLHKALGRVRDARRPACDSCGAPLGRDRVSFPGRNGIPYVACGTCAEALWRGANPGDEEAGA